MSRVFVVTIATLLIASPQNSLRAADNDSYWKQVRTNAVEYLDYLFAGGVDRDGDGELSANERAGAPLFRMPTYAALLVGLGCGLLGAVVTMRRMALFGDMIGHAVLPGVAVGFVVWGTKSTPALLVGALASGFLASGFTRAILAWSRLKEDAALGISLSIFYALGAWLISWITRAPEISAQASGIDRYLFGNPGVVSQGDVISLAVASSVVVLLFVVFYKEIIVSTFDRAFSASVGIRMSWVDTILLVTLTSVIVVSIKILGVVLVVAMLTIPPATAYLLSDHFVRFSLLSAFFGALSGFGGVWISVAFDQNVGPCIVCFAFSLLTASFALSPKHGVISRFLGHQRHSLKVVRENLLSAAFRARERHGWTGGEIPIEAIAAERGETVDMTRRLLTKLRGSGWAVVRGDDLVLSEEGDKRAARIVRSHRLWELFLSREASLPDDHVHPGAEEIEHYIDEATLEELETLLEHPERDPHGRSIPKLGPAKP
ncbi:MAG: metal ABC transporter permease [Planctomycetota bacterium]